MADRPKGRDPSDGAQRALLRDVHEALKSAGWAMPQSEDDVRRAEGRIAESPAALPEALRDPAGAVERAARPEPLALPPGRQAAENLARAAREGGEVPPEIEEIMRRDRRAAEEAFDEDHHGEDVG
jgi:hypothetical protein